MPFPLSLAFPLYSIVSGVPATAASDGALRDELLDPITGDTVLDMVGGDQLMVYGVDGIDSDLQAAWQEVKGEWFLDLNEGVDWFGLVFAKNPNQGSISNEFIRVALLVPGVASIDFVVQNIDPRTRTLSATYRVTDDTGVVLATQQAVLSPQGVS